MSPGDVDKTVRSANDEALVNALTEIVSELRTRQLSEAEETRPGARRGGTDRLDRTLATHFRYTEETLFPALRALTPGAAGTLDEMEKSHWPLRESARNLSARMKIEDDVEGHLMARSFLATVMGHVAGEADILRGILQSLGEGQSHQLRRLLSERS